MSYADFLMAKKMEIEGDIKPFDKKENNELAKKYHSLSPMEQELFLLNNCRLVFKTASDYSYPNTILQDELIANGIIGLQKAILSFDASKNIQFCTYASTCIRNEMLMFLRKQKRYNYAIELDAPYIDQDEALTNLDRIPYLYGMIEMEENRIDAIYQKDILDQVLLMIQDLSESDFFLLMHYYGFGEYTKMTQQEIAEALSLSQSYVSRKAKAIVKKITKKICNSDLYNPE